MVQLTDIMACFVWVKVVNFWLSVGIPADVCLHAPSVEFTSDHRFQPCDFKKGYFHVIISLL